MSTKTMGIIAVVIVAVGGLFLVISLNSGDGDGDNSNDNSSSSSSETSLTSPTDADGNAEVVDYAIDMKNFSFSPNIIQAEPGETLKIKLISTAGTHNLAIDEFDISTKLLNTGGEEIVEITIPSDVESGATFEFYCAVGNHKTLGMVGTLQIK